MAFDPHQAGKTLASISAEFPVAEIYAEEGNRRRLERSQAQILEKRFDDRLQKKPDTYSLKPNGDVNLGDLTDLRNGQAIYTYVDYDAELRFWSEESKCIGTFERLADGSVQFAFSGTLAEANAYRAKMQTYHDNASLDEDGVTVGTANIQNLLDTSFPGNARDRKSVV